MVNGTPIALEGEEGEAIKECLLRGSMPEQDLLKHLLLKAGLIVPPKRQLVQADVKVNTAVTTTENAILVRSFKSCYFLGLGKPPARISANVNGLSAFCYNPPPPPAGSGGKRKSARKVRFRKRKSVAES